MFCKHCGAQLSEEAKFCNSCGTSLSGTMSKNDNTVPVRNKGMRKRVLGVALVAAVILLALTLLFGGDNSYQKPIDDFVEGFCEADGKLFVSSFSDAFIQEEIADRGYRNKAELTKKIQDNLDDFVDDYNRKLGKKWKYEYKVLYISEYDNQMDVEVEVELNGKKNSETVAFIFVLVKDGNKWLIDYYF